jgi:hypothetical protein
MIVRNQLFLTRPWLVPIYSIIGAGLGLWFASPGGVSVIALAIAAGVVSAVNMWFFWSLKQTREIQKRSK